jgi:signal transduction histidine kinase
MRPWQIWTAAIVCLALVVTAFGWLSFKAIAADRAEHLAQEQAQLEENVRLALWRMDTRLAALLADESMRPTYNYTAALSLAQVNPAPTTKNTAPSPRDFLLISPLLNTSIAEVRFHFQIDAAGQVTSPSVPTAEQCLFVCPTYVGQEQVHKAEAQLAILKKVLQKQNLAEQLTKIMESNAGWLAWQDDNGEALQLSNGGVISLNGNASSYYGNQLLVVPEQSTNGVLPNLPSTINNFAASSSTNLPPPGSPAAANAPDVVTNGGSLANPPAVPPQLPQSDNPPQQPGAPQQQVTQNAVKYLNPNEGYTRGGNRQNNDTSQAFNQQSKPSQRTQQNEMPAQQAALPQQGEDQQLQRSVSEFQQRAAYVDNSSLNTGRGWNDDANRQAINNYWALNLTSANKVKGSAPQPTIRTSRMVPLWIDQELFLVRRVMVGGDQVIQGCWLDWNIMRGELLKVIGDLLPKADLQAVASDSAEGPRILASLPVRLNPGLLAITASSETLSPLGWSLLLAWSALAIAVVAIGLVGQGTIALSERRAVFVSAVTHELRTPLTTFRMYAEMLAEDMISDEATRRSYCRTLHHEADRLSHLVENVLAYAKLERGGPGERRVSLSLGELLRIVTERVTNRATQANFELVATLDDSLRDKMIHTDPGAVEQIVFNLVDNSCKYAASAEDRRLHLELLVGKDGQLRIQVRDHGPGIPAAERNQLFLPFRKSAARAAVSAPGVGLGLALCRRLARAMDGDLRLASNGSGTCFELQLPLA